MDTVVDVLGIVLFAIGPILQFLKSEFLYFITHCQLILTYLSCLVVLFSDSIVRISTLF